MELVKLTHENIEQEHICCAISGNKDIQVMSKKNWLKDRLNEGLAFLPSRKKMGFLSDPKYMGYKGFQTGDSVGRHEDMPEGFVLYYTNQCPSPFTTFSLFYDGQFVTHEILSEKKFDKILADKGV